MKIDVTKIEGYAEMTPEEKVQALEAIDYDIPEPDYTGWVKKEMLDKAMSEASEWKKKHNSLLNEDEQQKLAYAEELETLRQTVASMEQEKTIAEIKASYISMGYDEELAEDTARASITGDNKRIFANHKKFLEAHDKAFEASLLSKTPRIDGTGASGTPATKTKEEIMAIRDTQERQKQIAEHIELFKN